MKDGISMEPLIWGDLPMGRSPYPTQLNPGATQHSGIRTQRSVHQNPTAVALTCVKITFLNGLLGPLLYSA